MTPAIERAEGGICNGHILTLVEIVTCVPPHQKHLKRTINSTYSWTLWVQGESLEPCHESTLDPMSLFDIRNYQVPLRPEAPLRHPQLLGSSRTTSIQDSSPSDGTIPLVGSPDLHIKGPPRRLTPPRWVQLSGRISRCTESIASSDYLHVLNVSVPQFQWGQLWIVADIFVHQS